jgi:hypothetical protein
METTPAEADAPALPDSMIIDMSVEPPPLDPDAACASVVEQAKTEQLPVDILWMVDNSVSMKPAVEEVTKGLNAFAALIAGKSLDYRVIMLSIRSKTSPVTVNGGTRYPVCIPPPLAGDDQCGNSPRFFQSNIDLLSTQTLEQFLGTLGQTAGYTPADPKGGEPWKDQLRPGATRTIVVVTDDNARLDAQNFEHFSGGKNPFNSLTLPAGILEPVWNAMFEGYVFDAVYGYGSDTDDGEKCTYPDSTQPPASGLTYTALVKKTGGVRAKICDGAPAWQPFFEQVAQGVWATSKLSCELAIPVPDGGTLDKNKINVQLAAGADAGADAGAVILLKVPGAADCATEGGWYYDDEAAPQKVILCPASCDTAQGMVGPGKDGRIEVLFGCETQTIIK